MMIIHQSQKSTTVKIKTDLLRNIFKKLTKTFCSNYETLPCSSIHSYISLLGTSKHTHIKRGLKTMCYHMPVSRLKSVVVDQMRSNALYPAPYYSTLIPCHCSSDVDQPYTTVSPKPLPLTRTGREEGRIGKCGNLQLEGGFSR